VAPDTVDIQTLTREVLANCHISDATHAGLFSICGLALRMRDLYKWEKRLPPWKERAEEEILDWIGRREELWEQVAEHSYGRLTLGSQHLDPFDTTRINDALKPHGLFYGAGYGYSLKPTFFLGRIAHRKVRAGHRVCLLDLELARDLMTLPAMAQDGAVIVRTEAARMYLWDQIQYLNKSGKPFLRFALETAGVRENGTAALRRALPTLLATQTETYLYHEIGEMADTAFDRDAWRELIADHPHTPVELLARVVKDLLADTGPQGTLAYLVTARKPVGLALFAAFHDGLGRTLFPEFRKAFSAFIETARWEDLEAAIAAGHRRACRMATEITGLHREGKTGRGPEWVAAQIEKRYGTVLGYKPVEATA
jgi:hypothetical protein